MDCLENVINCKKKGGLHIGSLRAFKHAMLKNNGVDSKVNKIEKRKRVIQSIHNINNSIGHVRSIVNRGGILRNTNH